MGLWITPEGVDYLTEIIETPPSRYTKRNLREQDILGSMEFHGGGYSKEQTVDFLESRPIRNPLWGGSRSQYFAAIEDLISRGYVQDL